MSFLTEQKRKAFHDAKSPWGFTLRKISEIQLDRLKKYGTELAHLLETANAYHIAMIGLHMQVINEDLAKPEWRWNARCGEILTTLDTLPQKTLDWTSKQVHLQKNREKLGVRARRLQRRLKAAKPKVLEEDPNASYLVSVFCR